MNLSLTMNSLLYLFVLLKILIIIIFLSLLFPLSLFLLVSSILVASMLHGTEVLLQFSMKFSVFIVHRFYRNFIDEKQQNTKIKRISVRDSFVVCVCIAMERVRLSWNDRRDVLSWAGSWFLVWSLILQRVFSGRENLVVVVVVVGGGGGVVNFSLKRATKTSTKIWNGNWLNALHINLN